MLRQIAAEEYSGADRTVARGHSSLRHFSDSFGTALISFVSLTGTMSKLAKNMRVTAPFPFLSSKMTADNIGKRPK